MPLEKTAFPDVIETERLILRKHSLDQAEAMFHLIEPERDRLGRFVPWVERVKSVHDMQIYIQMTRDKWDSGLLFDYGIFRREDDAYLGNCGTHSVAWEHRRLEIGYWLFQAFEGQGYATEAIQALEKVSFANGFHRLVIACDPLNQKSSALPKRLGYRREGTLRDHMIISGKTCSTEIYAKLSSDAHPQKG